MKRTARLVAALVVASSAVVTLAASPASATAPVSKTDPWPGCRAHYVPWDPDEGAGAGWSDCTTPYQVAYHMIVLKCYYGGDSYGNWARPWEASTTTCVDGSGAYASAVAVK